MGGIKQCPATSPRAHLNPHAPLPLDSYLDQEPARRRSMPQARERRSLLNGYSPSGLVEPEGSWLAHEAQRQALPRSDSGTRASAAKLTFALVHQHSTLSLPTFASVHSFGLPHNGQVRFGRACMATGPEVTIHYHAYSRVRMIMNSRC
jgi:hypothetical protein